MSEFDYYYGKHTGGEIDDAVSAVETMLDRTQLSPITAIISDDGEVKHYPIVTDISLYSQDFEIPTARLLYLKSIELRDLARSACAYVKLTGVSSLPASYRQLPNQGMTTITEDFIVVAMRLSNPQAQLGTWTVDTTTAYVTVDGDISGTTDIEIFLAKPYYA